MGDCYRKKPLSMNLTTANETELREALMKDPSDWEIRKRLAHLLYDQGSFLDAAKIIWSADEIPAIDLELAFAARVLAKAAPRKAIRLLSALIEHNRGKAVQNLGLANALLHHGMVLQAARFYGAAMEADPTLGNPDLEHFILWTDDEETLWGNFNNRRPKLGELPWMKRDPQEAMKLTASISRHTTPIKVANLQPAPGEELTNVLYEQTPEKGADPSPPPAVTIPLDRVAPKDRLFDPELGAPSEPEPVTKKAPRAIKQAKPTVSRVPENLPEGPPTSATPALITPDLPQPDLPRPDVPKPDLPKPKLPPLSPQPSLLPAESAATPTARKRAAPAKPPAATGASGAPGLKKLTPTLPARPQPPPPTLGSEGK